jgi:hypothetical protein
MADLVRFIINHSLSEPWNPLSLAASINLHNRDNPHVAVILQQDQWALELQPGLSPASCVVYRIRDRC